MKQRLSKTEKDAEAEAPCGDGSKYCSDSNYPVCCMNGSALMFCCAISHPVCNLGEEKCMSRFEEAMLAGTAPSEDLKVDSQALVKVEDVASDAQTACGDGTKYCSDSTHPICCMNGSALMFCCAISHPVCNLSTRQCMSKFEEAMLAGTAPLDEEMPVAELQEESGVTAEAHCGDGSYYCSDEHPICCMNGSALMFCCKISHPVCNLAQKTCMSKFEEAMLAGAEPLEQQALMV